MKQTVKTKRMKFDPKTLETSFETIEHEVEDTFTACNLECHQLTERSNIDCMMDLLNELEGSEMVKGQIRGWLKQQLKNSSKMAHAMKEFEKQIGVCKTITIEVE